MAANDFTLRRLDELTTDEKAAMRALHVEAFANIASLTSAPGEMEWSSGDFHFTSWEGTVAISHVGVVVREGLAGAEQVVIGGIGDVCTLPSHQGRGLASTAMSLATGLMRDHHCDLGLLVCRPPMIPYYAKLGWQVQGGPVFVRRFGERIRFELSTVMVLPFATTPAAEAEMDLLGPPW